MKRAANDYGGNLWEIPGGSCETQESVLDGTVRELWEESGLVAKKVVRQVGEVGQWMDRGKLWNKFSFEVVVEEGEVVLDEDEHQDFEWATEEECRGGFVVRDGKRVVIEWAFETTLEVILEGFRLKREERKVEV